MVGRFPLGIVGGELLTGSGAANGVVGGYKVGDAGAVGSVYEGFTLSYADDFTTLDIVGPQKPQGKYFPTKNYGSGIRGNQTSSGTAQETDPLWTGYNDANRGVAANINNMYASGSALVLGARKATAGEQAFFTPTNGSINGGVRPQVSAMVHTAGAINWFPTQNPVIIEWYASFSGSAPAGWHPSLWQFATLLRAADGTEIDFEGASFGIYTEIIDHTGGVTTTQNSNGPFSYMDGVMRKHTIVIQNSGATGNASTGVGPVKYYVDDVLKATYAHDGNGHNMLHAALMSSHVLNANYNGDVYSQAAWDAATNPAEMRIGYMRVWRKTGVGHWKPLTTIADLNVAYNGTGSIVLPSAATLWGDGAVIEEVQSIPYDSMEPGMDTQTYYTTALPSTVTYTSGTRTVAADFSADTTGKAGRIHMAVFGYKADGSTCEPARFSINRGPNITVSSVEPTPVVGGGFTADLYFAADVGLIFPKTFSIPDLPAGWTLDPATGILTNPSSTVAGSTVTLTVTNGAGQSATKSIELWSPAMASSVFTWDTTNSTAMPNDGSGKVQFLYDIYDNTKALAQSTSANRPLISTAGGVGNNKRVMSLISNPVCIRSDDAAALGGNVIKAAADTTDVRVGDFYYVLAAKETSISTVNRILGWFNVAGTQFSSLRYTASGRGVSIQGAGGAAQTADQAVQDTNMHVFEVIKTGASVVFKLDGTQVATVTLTQTGGIAGDLFILGGAQAGGAFIGQLGPGFFTKTLPSAADQTRARNWVASRMGVTVV